MPRQAPTGIPSLTVTPYGSMGSPRDDTPYTFISPLDLSSIQPSIDLGPMDLDYLDLVEAARDAIAPENILTPEQQLQLAQEKAAKRYADLVLSQPTTAADIAAVQQAKQDLVDLGVTRRQLEAEDIDTGAGISGVMGPTFSGAVGRGIDIASEQFGLLGEGLASLVGADEALSAVLATLPTPGATFVFGEGGTQRPFITGQTPSGTQVGITDPYGISNILGTIQEGGGFDLSDVVGGIAGVYGPTALATEDEDEDEDEDEEVKTGADVVKVGDTTGDTTDGTTQTVRTDDITGDTTQTVRTDDTTSDTSVFDDTYDDVRVEDIFLDAVTPGQDTRTETPDTRTETPDTSSSGGGFGLPTDSGVAVTTGGPGPLVDLDYLIDPYGRSIIPEELAAAMAREKDEDSNVKKFSGEEGSQVTAQDYFDATSGNQVTAQDYFDATSGNQASNTGAGGSGVSQYLPILGAVAGGLASFFDRGNQNQPIGYTGGIPSYQATRDVVPGVFDATDRRPGSSGRRYFTDTQFTPVTDATGAPTIMGADQLAAMNQAYADQQAAREQQQADFLAALANLTAATPTPEPPPAPPPAPTPAPTPAPPIQIQPGATTLPAGTPITMGPRREDAVAQPTTPTGNTLQDLIDQAMADSVASAEEGQEVFNRALMLGASVDDLAAMSGLPASEIQNFIDLYGLAGSGSGLAQEGSEYDLYTPPGFAQGGMMQGRGYYLGGSTDGMADQIPATINNAEPARLSDGEFVIPADVVSHLGNGNSDAGADVLYTMMDRVRKARTGRKEQGREINPNKMLPA